jgi:hypothetical protein
MLDGRKVGIIGYVTPETKEVSNSEDIIFLDEIESVTKVRWLSSLHIWSYEISNLWVFA